MTAGNFSIGLYIAAALLVVLGVAIGLFGKTKPYRERTANVAATMILTGVLFAGAAPVIYPLGPWLLSVMHRSDSSACDLNPTDQALCDRTPNQTLPEGQLQSPAPSPGIPGLNN